MSLSLFYVNGPGKWTPSCAYAVPAVSKDSQRAPNVLVVFTINALRIHWERVVNSPKTFAARCESFETVGLFNYIRSALRIHWERAPNRIKQACPKTCYSPVLHVTVHYYMLQSCSVHVVCVSVCLWLCPQS